MLLRLAQRNLHDLVAINMNTLQRPPYQPEGPVKRLSWIFLKFLRACIMPLVLVVILASSFFFVRQIFSVAQVKLPTLVESKSGVFIYDRDGKYVCTMHHERDVKPVPLEKMSIHMRNAVVAIEDRHFFEHEGIDVGGIVRASIKNYQAGKIVEGASTITQQLVKCLYLDPDDRTYRRKFREAIMAVNVDLNYSKKKILEAYLNEIYFGDGVYGVERAAQNYFNKHASQLNLQESTYLASLIKAPSYLALPENRPEVSLRQHAILDSMVECGFIKKAEADEAKLQRLVFHEGPPAYPFPNYINCVMAVLKRELGDKLWANGWKVYTNLDTKAQAIAEKSLNKGIKKAPKGINQGALVSMSLKDGALLSIVGGVGKYDQIQWNRALAKHTAGSSFKPFVYLAALEQGIIGPNTMVNDSPMVIKSKGAPDWEPKNFDRRFNGWMPVRTALAQSRNVCAVRVAQEVGMNSVVMTARAAGITSQLETYPAVALGSCAVTPMEMATAYATLARGGIYMAPQVLRSVQYEDGRQYKVYRATPSANLSSEAVAQLVDVMQDVVKRGTATRAALKGIAVAGKTGTADGARDLWFIGFTPDTVTAVWGGNEQNKPVRGGLSVTGGAVMAAIWKDYMSQFYQIHKPPVGIAFLPPSKELIKSIPKFDQNTMLASAYGGLIVERRTEDDRVVQPMYPAEEAAAEKRINETGLASATELQRIQASKKLRATLAAQSGVQSYQEQHGVQTYGVQYEVQREGEQRSLDERIKGWMDERFANKQDADQEDAVQGGKQKQQGNGWIEPRQNGARGVAGPSLLDNNEVRSQVRAGAVSAIHGRESVAGKSRTQTRDWWNFGRASAQPYSYQIQAPASVQYKQIYPAPRPIAARTPSEQHSNTYSAPVPGTEDEAEMDEEDLDAPRPAPPSAQSEILY